MMKHYGLPLAALVAIAIPALAADEGALILEERVTGGSLDLSWETAFGLENNVQAMTLEAGHPAYDNPSGDHTVAVLKNSEPDFGGLGKSVTDPGGYANYSWSGWFFTGDGDTRRGIVLRADDEAAFTQCYQLVLDAGLLNLRFRLLSGEGASTLEEWFTTDTPTGLPQPNTWHHLKVIANGDEFRCFFDGYELTDEPIVDSTLATGWVGVYNFRFDLGGIPVYFDDLTLCEVEGTTPILSRSWGEIKNEFLPNP